AMAARLTDAPAGALTLSGPGLTDVTRIAGGDTGLWTQILAANAAPVARVLAAVAADLSAVAAELAEAAPEPGGAGPGAAEPGSAPQAAAGPAVGPDAASLKMLASL